MFNASTGTLVGATWVCLISVASIIFEEYNMVQHPELRACIKALPNICSSILARADTIRKDHRGIQLSTFVSFALMLRGLGDFTLELNHTHYGALLALFLYQASYTAYLIVLRREAKYVKEMFTGEILLSVCAAMVCLLGTYSVAINKSVYQDFPMMANLHDLLMGLTVWRLLTRNHSLGTESYFCSMLGGILLFASDSLAGLRRAERFTLSFAEVVDNGLYHAATLLILLSTMTLRDSCSGRPPLRPSEPMPLKLSSRKLKKAKPKLH